MLSERVAAYPSKAKKGWAELSTPGRMGTRAQDGSLRSGIPLWDNSAGFEGEGSDPEARVMSGGQQGATHPGHILC